MTLPLFLPRNKTRSLSLLPRTPSYSASSSPTSLEFNTLISLSPLSLTLSQSHSLHVPHFSRICHGSECSVQIKLFVMDPSGICTLVIYSDRHASVTDSSGVRRRRDDAERRDGEGCRWASRFRIGGR
ncbi:hypothetical protein C1H46_020760 [Malus baccata]|uniref:Uncharacterized protein n=1 Tax=Malus baccata TaxID=106549 RepID=A0A540M4F1_MALBA|nr:hypothetical protein C1H46_020760 [Malus baccata]